MEYKKGSILELPVKKKLTQSNFIIFELGDFSGRLHISQLSNNRTLSQKMFDLIQVGEVINVLVWDFNIDEQYYVLSTKALRNYLDDSLDFNTCTNIIRQRYESRNNQETEFLLENRNMLDRLRGDLSSNELTFLYELIQNAVDHPNKNFNELLNIHFEVYKNYLLVKHNGALFTENNFISLTGILYGEQNEDEDSGRIGYKGIGFKSVFRHSINVYVRSGNFSFCFNEEITGLNKPWEVMPIFQNEIQKIDVIKQFNFFNAPVAFALEFTNEQAKLNVIQYLIELKKNPYLLVFLQKLNELKISVPNENFNFYKQIQKKDYCDLYELKDSNGELSDWFKFSETFEIEDQEILDELNDTSNKSIPNYYRNFRKPKIEILIPQKRKENLVNLFAYLPMSNTRYGLPYIINSHFIPNLDRTNFIDSLKYNYKLVYYTSEFIVNICSTLSRNRKFESLKLLLPTFKDDLVVKFKSILKAEIIKHLKSIEIFPIHNIENKYSNLESLIIDKNNLFEIFSNQNYQKLFRLNGNVLSEKFGDYSEIEILFNDGNCGKILTTGDLKVAISYIEFQEWLKIPENNTKFLNHVYENEQLEEIRKEAIMLTNKNTLAKAKDIYETLNDKVSSFNEVIIINQEVLNGLNNGIDFKFKEYKVENVFKELFEQDLLKIDNLINEEKIISQWNWVYDEWDNIKFNNEIIKVLKSKNIVLKNSNNFKKITETYLSNEFQDSGKSVEEIVSEFDLENVEFVSPEIITESRKKENWFNIFKQLKVKTSLDDVISEVIEKLDQIHKSKHPKITIDIFNYWKKNPDQKIIIEGKKEKLRGHLVIKCMDGSFVKPNEAIISDHYKTEEVISSILPNIKLKKEIASSYDINRTNTNHWNKFFRELLVCVNLNEKQQIIDEKVKYYIENQNLSNLKENHFKILESLSIENNLNLDSEDLKKIKLKSENGEWLLANKLYISDSYKPKINFQIDENIQNVKFICNDYKPDKIPFKLLLKIGLNANFNIQKVSKIKRENIDSQYLNYWENKNNYIRTNAMNYALQHKIENHFQINFIKTLIIKRYSLLFWKEVISNSKMRNLLGSSSTYKTAYNTYNDINYAIYSIRQLKCFPNKNSDLCLTKDLYSIKYKEFLSNDLIPLYDFSVYQNKELNSSLENILGVGQFLTPELALLLIGSNKINFNQQKVNEVNLIEILNNSNPIDDETYYLPNNNYEWTDTKDLVLIESEVVLKIENKQILHSDFKELADSFKIPIISKDRFGISINPTSQEPNKEIYQFFKDKGKFIAFYINQEEDKYLEISDKLIQSFAQYDFFEVQQIQKFYPNNSNPIIQEEIIFYIDGKSIYYKDIWYSNDELVSFLIDNMDNEKLNVGRLKRIARFKEAKIIDWLNEEFNNKTPLEFSQKKQKVNRNFEDTVNDFINTELKEAEEIYNADQITELKNILQSFVGHEKEDQIKLNIVAKLKLCNKLKFAFNINNYDCSNEQESFNKIVEENHKYFVHSARGAFAYIHPNEILLMKDEGYKMAIDFGKNEIKIFDTVVDLINFHNNYLMLYQNPNDSEKIVNLCEQNKSNKRFHFLLVNKEKDTESIKDIMKIMNLSI